MSAEHLCPGSQWPSNFFWFVFFGGSCSYKTDYFLQERSRNFRCFSQLLDFANFDNKHTNSFNTE